MNYLKLIALVLWQLPQTLLGAIIYIFLGGKKRIRSVQWRNQYGWEIYAVSDEVCLIESKHFHGGISLGNFVFLDAAAYKDVLHECGHCKQSQILGPLYLLVIGIPSLFGNIYDRIAHKKWSQKKSYYWYYNQPWEKWADRVYGVKR